MKKEVKLKKLVGYALVIGTMIVATLWLLKESNEYFHKEIPAKELAKLEKELKSKKGCEALYRIGQMYIQDGKITANEASHIRGTLDYCQTQTREREQTRKNVSKLLTNNS